MPCPRHHKSPCKTHKERRHCKKQNNRVEGPHFHIFLKESFPVLFEKDKEFSIPISAFNFQPAVQWAIDSETNELIYQGTESMKIYMSGNMTVFAEDADNVNVRVKARLLEEAEFIDTSLQGAMTLRTNSYTNAAANSFFLIAPGQRVTFVGVADGNASARIETLQISSFPGVIAL